MVGLAGSHHVVELRGHAHLVRALRIPPHPGPGVSRFGQAGALEDVYRYHGIDADAVVRAGLDLLD